MIVVDIETSGLYPEKHGIWQIGALDFYNPQYIFLQESRIDEEDKVTEEALKVIEKTEAELRDTNKQSQKKLLENFFHWMHSVRIKNAICENPQFDLGFISSKARKYNLKYPFHHRAFDLHSIAQLKYHQLNGEFYDEKDHSGMGLSKILEYCGLSDKRTRLEAGKVVQEGTPHNALEDTKLTAECLSRLLIGKSLIKEYSHYKVPECLAWH